MERNYDLFERLQNNALVWRGSVHGLESTRRKLQELANSTANECFAMYTPTRQIVALLNVAPASQVPPQERGVSDRIRRARTRRHSRPADGQRLSSYLGNWQ